MRLIAVWCPDFPAVAAAHAGGHDARSPVAVTDSNKIVVCTASARAHGVRRGQRLREAQTLCPDLVVVSADGERDAAAIEPVAAAVEEVVAGVEILRPGLLVLAASGPARYYGSEEAAAERLVDAVEATGVDSVQVGIADTVFAATVAAHHGLLVPPGTTPEFLAPLGIRVLDQPSEPRARWPEFLDLLSRLGIRTLGEFAALPVSDVSTRFGPQGTVAHQRARGADEHAPHRRTPPADLSVHEEFDPALERVDVAAFAAKRLGEQLHGELAGRGLVCTRLAIRATTELGAQRERIWRCAEPLTVAGMVDRVRWQLDGWLRVSGPGALGSGITVLHLEPTEVLAGTALQLDLLTNSTESDAAERAGRAMVRVQGILGADGVQLPLLGGGRTPQDAATLVPWGDARDPDPRAELPWPGRMLPPTPTTLVPGKPVAGLFADDGSPVRVVRSALNAPPATVQLTGFPRRRVLAWGPVWPLWQQFWSPEVEQVSFRLQLTCDTTGEDGELAVLLGGDGQRWWLDGIYQ
ncbi:DNA polymerase Y family protein [Allokutzneria multivorans]|uniref:DNA polymerase Y family protein n=1 Tax=Allokutzneria multivorans TaxID=1142134 RepID=A0ABP7SE74_9PSEU